MFYILHLIFVDTMRYLVGKLTPPAKGSKASEMSPKSFLASEEAMSPLKRKARFKRLNKDMTKKFRLDPSIEDGDFTIAVYYARTQALLPNDREKLHVHIPFEAEIERIQGILRVRLIFCST